MTNQLSVVRSDGVAALERYAADIDRLNAASERPNGFSSSAFLINYSLRNEYYRPGEGERLFLVREQGRVIGCAPMRQARERLSPAQFGPLRLAGTRLEFLAAADTEQLEFLSAPQDQERVVAALLQHFCERERDWGMLELVGQKPSSALYHAVHGLYDSRFWSRDIEVQPYTEVPLGWPDLRSYFRSLTKHMRSNIGRQARRLFAAGETELVFARGGVAVGAWFDAYCDLDSRSWKSGTVSSISRSPRRVRLYRDLANGNAGFDPSFVGVVLEGVLVAGLLVGSNQTGSAERHGAWCLEMAYDRGRAELGPGQMLLLSAVGEALSRGDRFLNFLQNFAYYKHRWGAEPIDVANVQLIRRFSPHEGRARVGALQRWWLTRKQAGEPDHSVASNEPTKEPSEPPAAEPSSASPLASERARSLTAAALATRAEGMRRLDRAAAQRYLPFDLE